MTRLITGLQEESARQGARACCLVTALRQSSEHVAFNSTAAADQAGIDRRDLTLSAVIFVVTAGIIPLQILAERLRVSNAQPSGRLRFPVFGLYEDLRGRADFVDMPILEEGDAIRHFAREAHLMRHADHRHALGGQKPQRVKHLAYKLGSSADVTSSNSM